MVDRLYCLSNPAEPGLVRVTFCDTADVKTICKPGERIDWSLKVRHARTAVAALHRRMKLYRKHRGNGIYRCSPGDAKSIVMRYAALPRKGWSIYAANVYKAMLTTIYGTGYQRNRNPW